MALSTTEKKCNDVSTAWYKLESLISDIKDEAIQSALFDLYGEIVLLSDMVSADNQEVDDSGHWVFGEEEM